nr:protein ABHD11 [Parasteatoda tepidariorum]
MARSVSFHHIETTFVNPAGGIKDNKNPVIFLHAMLCSKEIWTNIPQAVANYTGRRVYTYDARNHGASSHTDESNFKFNVDDLFWVMDKIKKDFKTSEKEIPEQFVLVGHDMGGMTAISAALKEPNSFEKVIIVEMYAKRVPDYLIDRVKDFVTEWTKCVRELPKETPEEDVTRISVENLYKNLQFQENNEKESYKQGKFSYKKTENGWEPQYNTPALVKALDELKKEPEDYIGTYNGLASFLYGTASHYRINAEERSLKEHFPNAELQPLPEASHFSVADKPTQLAEKISKSINMICISERII